MENGHWTFPGLGKNGTGRSLSNPIENGIGQQEMMLNFAESGHPVF